LDGDLAVNGKSMSVRQSDQQSRWVEWAGLEDLLDPLGDRSLFFGLVEANHALHLASVIEHANFAASDLACPVV
jgi:hypothetical protein